MFARGAIPAASAALLAALLMAGCGGGSNKKNASANPPQVAGPQSFPSANGKTIAEIVHGLGPGPVLAPGIQLVTIGDNKFTFGLFDRARRQISGAPAALYVQPIGARKTYGPIPATGSSLAVAKPYQSKTVADDPNAAKSIYTADLRFSDPGNYEFVALVKLDDRLVATSPIALPVATKSQDPVPKVGERPPRIHTPTAASVGGDLSKIDTRDPPDDMHTYDFASVLGKKPIVLVFATPALCESRMCGPVTDMAVQVEHEHPGKAVFIHMEIYNDNDPKKGYRPQFRAFHLPSEPWIFAINREGRIAYRIDGAATVPAVEAAYRAAVSK
jgi:hypothetical protein